jgi:pyruvate/2-oxoglutarate dehydrogenase complex dihydrolipoamide acyltransferase (E2) component
MTRTIRLNDLQLVLLSSAAARDNGSLIPLPATCTQDSGTITKAVAALLRRGFVEELPVTDRSLAWREQDQEMIGVFITAPGRAAIGVDDKAGAQANSESENDDASDKREPARTEVAAPAPSSPPPPGSKIATVVALLAREQGATLDELVEATGWLPHTTRAALTGLRKKGRSINKAKRGEVTCYRIAWEQTA